MALARRSCASARISRAVFSARRKNGSSVSFERVISLLQFAQLTWAPSRMRFILSRKKRVQPGHLILTLSSMTTGTPLQLNGAASHVAVTKALKQKNRPKAVSLSPDDAPEPMLPHISHPKMFCKRFRDVHAMGTNALTYQVATKPLRFRCRVKSHSDATSSDNTIIAFGYGNTYALLVSYCRHQRSKNNCGHDRRGVCGGFTLFVAGIGLVCVMDLLEGALRRWISH
jgi:hypothetical protein